MLRHMRLIRLYIENVSDYELLCHLYKFIVNMHEAFLMIIMTASR